VAKADTTVYQITFSPFGELEITPANAKDNTPAWAHGKSGRRHARHGRLFAGYYTHKERN